MTGPDDYGKRQREPIFSVRGGKPIRPPELIEGAEIARDLDEAKGLAHLRQVHEAVAQSRGPVVEPPTRLQEIASAMLALPYGDFVEMSEGIKAAGSTELATLIHAWAKANVRGRNAER